MFDYIVELIKKDDYKKLLHVTQLKHLNYIDTYTSNLEIMEPCLVNMIKDFIETDLNTILCDDTNDYSYLDVAFDYDSIKCFTYLLKKGARVTSNLILNILRKCSTRYMYLIIKYTDIPIEVVNEILILALIGDTHEDIPICYEIVTLISNYYVLSTNLLILLIRFYNADAFKFLFDIFLDKYYINYDILLRKVEIEKRLNINNVDVTINLLKIENYINENNYGFVRVLQRILDF